MCTIKEALLLSSTAFLVSFSTAVSLGRSGVSGAGGYASPLDFLRPTASGSCRESNRFRRLFVAPLAGVERRGHGTPGSGGLAVGDPRFPSIAVGDPRFPSVAVGDPRFPSVRPVFIPGSGWEYCGRVCSCIQSGGSALPLGFGWRSSRFLCCGVDSCSGGWTFFHVRCCARFVRLTAV